MKKNLIVVVLLALALGGCKKMNLVGPSENPGPGHIPPPVPIELPGPTYLLDAGGNLTKFWAEIASIFPPLGSAVAIAPFNWPPGPIDWVARCQAVCYSVTMRYGVDPDFVILSGPYRITTASLSAHFTTDSDPDVFNGPSVIICGNWNISSGGVVECSTQGGIGIQPDGKVNFTTFQFLPEYIVVYSGARGAFGSVAIPTRYSHAP